MSSQDFLNSNLQSNKRIWKMPRRGNGGNRNWNQNGQLSRISGGMYSDEHDDRDRKPNNNVNNTKRRVSFKPSGITSKGGIKSRLAELAIKARLEDDEEMTDFNKAGQSRGNFKKDRRKGSPIPRGHGGKRKLVAGTSSWFLVTIPFGQKYEKDLIIRSILSAITPDIFIPQYWSVEKDCVTFYLDDLRIAERLLNADRTIQMPDGFRMLIKVRNSVPTVKIDDSVKERMKHAMVKRYNASTKALDLTKFHADPDLRDIFCALFRPTIMLAVIDIVSENIPHLEALNLQDNRIHLLDHFKCLAEKLPCLKILYLGNNRISSVAALEALKNIPLVELVLTGNSIRDRYRDESTYVSDVRKRLPKLIKLDGVELPPRIGFDLSEELSLPTPMPSYLCDPAGKDIVRQFLEEYYKIFDTDNRQPLLDAYHESAMLSITAASANNNSERLTSFWPFNRNLQRVRELDQRCRLLRNGRLPVVSLLSELPPTQHDPQSFAVDLTLFTPKLISFTVTGIFRELSSKGNNNNSTQHMKLRSFQRGFVIVPSGGGFCIRNEVFHICNTTPAQLKTAFKTPQITTPAPPPVSTSTPVVQAPVAAIHPGQIGGTSVPDETTKMQMVQAMSAQSNMNLEWSKKCLEETNWDFQRAAYVFTQLHKQNTIPPEAFAK